MSTRLPPRDDEDVPLRDSADAQAGAPLHSAAFVAQAAGQSLPERTPTGAYTRPRKALRGKLRDFRV